MNADVSAPITLRDQIVFEARSWLRTPFHHRAMVKGAGVDCASLLIAVFSACGLEANTQEQYPQDWHLHRDEERFIREVLRFCVEIEASDLLPCDVIVWKFGRCYSHGAIYIGDNTVVHAVVNLCVLLGYLTDEDLYRREKRYFRHRALI